MGRIILFAIFLLVNVALITCVAQLEVFQVQDSKCLFNTYSVGLREGASFNELYRTCYDNTNVAAKYTQHTIYPTIGGACTGQVNWRLSGIITGQQESSFNNDNIRAKTHARFPQYDRGHLAPCADFPDSETRRATYQIINAVPQVHSLNNGRWKRMEKFLRNRATSQGVSVVTGGLGVLQYNSNPIYLWLPNGNPIPEFMYKVAKVQNANNVELYAFVAHNSDDRVSSVRLQEVCQQMACPRDDLDPIVCCDAAQFVRKNIPNFTNFFNV